MEKKTFDIVAIGELLMDLTPYGTSPSGQQLYEANPGGAPGNALAMAAKLGSRCSMFAKIGEDAFGDLLGMAVSQAGIDPSGLRRDPDTPTTLALVSLDKAGERSFSFYRNPGADLMLRPDEINFELIDRSSIFHFGTLSMSGSPSRDAIETAVRWAKEHGCLVSFDPNIRRFAWKHEADLKHAVTFGLTQCDFLKMSDEELLYYTGRDDPADAARAVAGFFPNIRLIFVTLGPDGCMVYGADSPVFVRPFAVPDVTDTTGAGDSFWGVCLHHLAHTPPASLDSDTLFSIARQANAAASLVIRRKGALLAMPDPDEIYALL